ncbi:MAG: NUDIX hydrolase [Clostridiaceae bacterium]|nr:NUDIX hydrolase [Clostridiaceae bacterium]
MDYYEKTVSRKPIYEGNIIDVEVLTVELPNGRTAPRDVVRHSGAAVIVPVTDKGEVVLVKQYRKPIEQVSLEVPAGKLEKGEDPKICAARELKEETGYTAGKLEKILTLHPASAYTDEVLHVYLASDLTKGEANPDEDEFITANVYPMEEALNMIKDGLITDAKTVAGVLFAARLFNK